MRRFLTSRLHDLNLRRLRTSSTRRQSVAAIKTYLDAHPLRKLHLGAGGVLLPGWLNTDAVDVMTGIVVLDAAEPFPLDDETFDYVFTEHMIQYLTYERALRCLAECRRVLRPGGRIRIATPSLERIAGLAVGIETEEQRRYLESALERWLPEAAAPFPGFVVNNFFYGWGHTFLYDRQTLPHALERSGFGDVVEREVGKSDDPELADLEWHGHLIGDENNLFETFVLEAVRP